MISSSPLTLNTIYSLMIPRSTSSAQLSLEHQKSFPPSCWFSPTTLMGFPNLTVLTQLLIPPNLPHKTKNTCFFLILSCLVSWYHSRSPLIALVPSPPVSDPSSRPVDSTSLFVSFCVRCNHHRPSHSQPSPRPLQEPLNPSYRFPFFLPPLSTKSPLVSTN